MTTTHKYLLRVYVATDVAMKLALAQRPQSVEELKTIMQKKFSPRLDGEFTLQYEDPDFDGMLCCLIDIDELPEKGILRVVRTESDELSVASSDTDIMPHVPLEQRQKHWPNTFTVPVFSLDIEYVLQEAINVYRDSGKTLKLSRAQKHSILEKMAETVFGFKAYPTDRDLVKQLRL
ncbi:unnamed protein product [Knipowitschia caucasica]